MNAQAEFFAYLQAEIDGAMAALTDQIMRETFPVRYDVPTYEQALERDGRLYTACLQIAAGGDPYDRLSPVDEGCGCCPCCCDCSEGSSDD